MCRLGAHTLSHYTFFSGSDMVLYLCKISACCVKRKCKSRGGKKKQYLYELFSAFHIYHASKIVGRDFFKISKNVNETQGKGGHFSGTKSPPTFAFPLHTAS